MAVDCRLRFGARPSSRIKRALRDVTTAIYADFFDPATGQKVDASGVTATVFLPGGAPLTPALTPVREGVGVWRLDVTPAFSGDYRVQITCSAPDSATDFIDFTAFSSTPDASEPPPITDDAALVWLAGRSITVSSPVNLTQALHGGYTVFLTGTAHQVSLTWSLTGVGFSCVLVNTTSYDATPVLVGFDEAVVRNTAGRVAVAAGGTASLFCAEVDGLKVAYLAGEVA